MDKFQFVSPHMTTVTRRNVLSLKEKVAAKRAAADDTSSVGSRPRSSTPTGRISPVPPEQIDPFDLDINTIEPLNRTLHSRQGSTGSVSTVASARGRKRTIPPEDDALVAQQNQLTANITKMSSHFMETLQPPAATKDKFHLAG